MTNLEKIIYLADLIEPSRKFDGVDEIREVAYKDLDLGYVKGINSYNYIFINKRLCSRYKLC